MDFSRSEIPPGNQHGKSPERNTIPDGHHGSTGRPTSCGDVVARLQQKIGCPALTPIGQGDAEEAAGRWGSVWEFSIAFNER